MKLSYKKLTGISFEEMYNTFVEAFSDYAVDVSYMTPEIMKKRAHKNGYDPECSVGVFKNDKLVGFTLTGIGTHYGVPSAFDIMTGLVKEYQGMGIASKMFEFIKPMLNEKKIEHFYLEVLQENQPAVKAYQKAGFKINRGLDCFKLELNKFSVTETSRIPLKFNKIDKSVVESFEPFADWTPSWENSSHAINRIPDFVILIEAEYSINKVGLLVYYPTLNWIMALLVDPKYRKMGVGSALLKELINQLDQHTDFVKFLNIQSDDEPLISFLKQSGFEYIGGQHEMKYEV